MVPSTLCVVLACYVVLLLLVSYMKGRYVHISMNITQLMFEMPCLCTPGCNKTSVRY